MKKIEDYLQGERWLPIPGFRGYEASDRQRVRSIEKVVSPNYGGKATKPSRILAQHVNGSGYKAAGLCIGNVTFTRGVHRLIALAHIQNPENKPTVNHIDGDKCNNSLSNLEWATHAENVKHAWETGLNGKSPRTHLQNTCGVEAAQKPVTATNFRTGESKSYESITKCAADLGVTQSCISYALIRGGRVQRKYNIKFAA